MFSPDIPKIFSRLFPGVPEVCPVGGLLAFYVTCLKLLSGHGGMIGLCVCGRAWAHQCQYPWETLSQWGYEFQSPSLFLRGQLKGLSTWPVGWSSQDWALAPRCPTHLCTHWLSSLPCSPHHPLPHHASWDQVPKKLLAYTKPWLRLCLWRLQSKSFTLDRPPKWNYWVKPDDFFEDSGYILIGKLFPCRSFQNFYQPSILLKEFGPQTGRLRKRGKEVKALTCWAHTAGSRSSFTWVCSSVVRLASFSSVFLDGGQWF